MASSYVSLVKEAFVLLEQFRYDRRCLDDFIKDASKGLETIDTLKRKFILDVVSGCNEHKKLLDVVVNAFYGQKSKWLSRSDHSHYVIICYLVMFSLDDLGLQHFGNIIKSLDIKKMHTFLNFFFSNLTSLIQEGWNSIYEAAFVEKHWIGPLLRWRPEINILMDELAAKISQGSRVKKAPIKTIKPLEFSLTKPKLQSVPWPELIPQQKKCKPVPNSTYRAPKEIPIIEEIKEKNHQKAEALLYEANMTEFRCVNPQKSEHTTRAIAQIKEDLDSNLKFNSFRSSGVPPSNKANSCSVKPNNASIMRRKALYDRQMERELLRVEQLVQGVLDPSSFLQSQGELLERDPQAMLLMTEQKRLEARIREEEVALARKQVMEHNQKAAKQKKEETAQMMQKYAEKRLQEEKETKELIQQTANDHKNSKVAKEKLQKLKQRIVKEVSEQSQDLLRQALEEEQAKLCKRIEIIHEIHTIESLPRVRLNLFDDTEAAGHKLLDEMSLAELNERLALLKEARQKEEEEKRTYILEEKQMKKQQLQENLDKIEIQTRALAKAATIRKEEKKAKQDFLQQVVANDETLLALKRKLEEKKQEHQRWKEAERNKVKPCKQKTAYTVSHSAKHSQRSVKEKSWEELEQSLARYIQNIPDVIS